MDPIFSPENIVRKIKIIFFFLVYLISTFNCWGQLEIVKPDDGQSSSIFEQKCTNCHKADKSVMLLRDEKLWKNTLLRMRKKQGANITRADVEKLIGMHIERQKAEKELFLKECTRCHGLAMSLSDIKTKQEWSETIRQMMAKAKRNISDEKINLLIGYHVRYQNLIMRKCSRCHDLRKVVSLERDEEAWRKTVTAMSKEKDSDISEDEVDIIVHYHRQRQQKDRELFEKKCSNCHKRKNMQSPPEVEKTPNQWRATIRRMMKKSSEVISDENIATLIHYHMRAHSMITLRKLEAESKILGFGSAELFGRKCSACHSLDKALQTFRDQESWQKTIENMAKKKGSSIKKSDVPELVNLHVNRQAKEQELFLADCTQCHSSDVALGTPKTDEQWRKTARKMMNRAGKKISEEQLDILTRYHIRYEKAIADLAIKKCSRCHDRKRILTKRGTKEAWEWVIVVMSEKEGSNINRNDVMRLVNYHVARQKIEQETFTKDCSRCHESEETLKQEKSRDEWRQTIRRMMAKTDEMIPDEELDILIDYHVRRAQ